MAIKDIIFTVSAALGIPAAVLFLAFLFLAFVASVQPTGETLQHSTTRQTGFWVGSTFNPYVETIVKF